MDDSAIDAERAKLALSGTYEVEVFHDGADVLQRLAEGLVPDTIVLDWLMPDVSGLDVIEFLRRSPRFSQIGVLLLTVQQATPKVVQGLSHGANDYVSKPFAVEELRARVDALVRTRMSIERAEHAEETVRRLLDSHPDGLIAVDTAGDIWYANDRGLRVLGAAKPDVVGKALRLVLPVLAESLAHGGSGPLGDLELDGRVLAPWLSDVMIDEERVMLIALRDVTEERKAQARRIDFYSMIAHDLRSPLHAIHLRCELGRQGLLSEPAQIEECFEKLSGHTSTLVSLIDDFLELGRLETMRELKRENIDLVLLLKETIELLEPLARQKQIALSMDAPDHAEVIGDRTRLSQVISNILGNALKFTPSAGHVAAQVSYPSAEIVELSVTDDGPGVAEEDLPHIFERYRRAGRGSQTAGTGLGLSIVREVVDAHAGDVGVERLPLGGSRFWVRLPIRQVA